MIRFGPGLCALALAGALAACTYEGDAGPLPAVQRTLELERMLPAAGSRGAAIDTRIDLYFSAPIAGESVTGVDVRLFSGRIEVQGRARVDLFARRIRFTPFATLRPELLHRVYIGDRIRGLDGSRLAEPLTALFTTGNASSGPPPSEPAPPDGEALQPLWAARCASCHGGAAPQAGLDLGSAARARASLVGVPSEQAPLLRVAPGAHAESYLLRKLWRSYAFAGLPMPPDEREALDAVTLQHVAAWIDGGAR